MEIFDGHRSLLRPLVAPAVALGNFDGVHRGHQRLLARAVAAARRLGGDAVVYTLEPHPAKVLAPEIAPALITTADRKLELLAHYGVDVCVREPFTPELAQVSAEQFTEEIVARILGAAHIVVGYDFTYGHKRAGTVDTLRAFGERSGIAVEVVEPVVADGTIVSSTAVRELVRSGDMRGARLLLGREFEVDGEVVRGAGRGKALGFPTANLRPATELLPSAGIYAAEVQLLDTQAPEVLHAGAVSLGTNPTFADEDRLSLEAFLLDFDGDLYGRMLRIRFVERLRPERRFASTEALAGAIRDDVDRTRRILDGRAKVAEF